MLTTQVKTTPAATYSPCVFETRAYLAVASGAVGSQLWVIARRTGRTTTISANLQTAPRKLPAGHSTCFVLEDVPHVLYRVDKFVFDVSSVARS